MKPKAYIETTVPSYLTAWPSGNLVRAAHQRQTALWWAARDGYDLYGSELLLDECRAGEPGAATARLEAVRELAILEQGAEVADLTEMLMKAVPLPAKAVSDATHIATAAVHGMDLLITWNCRHINNPVFRPLVEAACRAAGYEPPTICTPGDLLGELLGEEADDA